MIYIEGRMLKTRIGKEMSIELSKAKSELKKRIKSTSKQFQ
jgi:hypothetical protein